MASMSGYTEVLSKVKPANSAKFKVVDWKDVDWDGFELPDGVAGADRLHVKYAPVQDPDESWLSSKDSNSPNAYVGLCVDKSDEAPTDPSKYAWSRIAGATVRPGSGKPTLGGSVGDLYVDVETGELYEYAEIGQGKCSWVNRGSLRGPAGDRGTGFRVCREEAGGAGPVHLSDLVPSDGVSVGDLVFDAAGKCYPVTSVSKETAELGDEIDGFEIKGEDGKSPTIAVGALKVVDDPDEAYAKNVGDDHALVLEIGLPAGRDGRTPDVSVGSTETVGAGSPAKVTANADDGSVVLDFEIPRGADGKSVEVGAVLTETSAAGSDAEVYASEGADGKTEFRFVIPQGPQGPQGDRGPEGVQGPKGDQGDKGERGERGERGESGLPSSIAVGSVSKLDPGAAPTVSATTDAESNVTTLDFGIPQGLSGKTGDKGEKGDTGATGPAGPQGVQGPQGEQGPQGPQGERGEKGDKGDTGEAGAKGDKGDQGVQGLQGEPGKDARIASVSVNMVEHDQPASGSVEATGDGDAITLNIPRQDASLTFYAGDSSVSGSDAYGDVAAALNDILKRLSSVEVVVNAKDISIASVSADPSSVERGVGGSVRLSWSYADGSAEPISQSISGVVGAPDLSASDREATVKLDGKSEVDIVLMARAEHDKVTASKAHVGLSSRIYFGLAPANESPDASFVSSLQWSSLQKDAYVSTTQVTATENDSYAWFACPADLCDPTDTNAADGLLFGMAFYPGAQPVPGGMQSASTSVSVHGVTYVVARSDNALCDSGDSLKLRVAASS